MLSTTRKSHGTKSNYNQFLKKIIHVTLRIGIDGQKMSTHQNCIQAQQPMYQLMEQ